MVAIGLPHVLAAYWAMVWINMPGWIVAVGAGVVAGAMRRHSAWLRFSLLSCVAFILTPHLMQLLILGVHPWPYFGPRVAVQAFLWNAVSIPLLLLGAWLTARRKRPSTPNGAKEIGCQPA
jgi:hypothetical protein